MIRRSVVVFAILTLVLTVGIWMAGSAYAANPCTAEQGQLLIDSGQYTQAVAEFTCVIGAEPTGVEGYRGRIEALLLLGQFSNAVGDYARVTALVLPVHPDAQETILAGYKARLKDAPQNIHALTGASFARWWFFDYAQAIHHTNQLLALQPSNLFGNLFRGSSRLLHRANMDKGAEDLERALALAPQSADVRFIVADAYTYGQPEPQRALAEATLALNWGLDTPRVHAILGSAYLALGDQTAAAFHIHRHIDLVTTELVGGPGIGAGTSQQVSLVPGRTYELPLPATAGETISVLTSSRDFYDSILVLLAPDGSPVVGGDDYDAYFAGFEWVADVTGTYRLWVTSFESVSSGQLVVTRK